MVEIEPNVTNSEKIRCVLLHWKNVRSHPGSHGTSFELSPLCAATCSASRQVRTAATGRRSRPSGTPYSAPAAQTKTLTSFAGGC